MVCGHLVIICMGMCAVQVNSNNEDGRASHNVTMQTILL